jgi:hypothetical protein
MPRITIAKAKALTKEENRYVAFDKLYKQLESRTWTQHGRTYRPAGFSWHSSHGPQAFHLTFTEACEGGGVFHARIKLALDEAIDCINGDFEFVKRI